MEITLKSPDLYSNVSLDKLAELINKGHENITLHLIRTGGEIAQIGSWLIAAKGKCEYGTWDKWKTDNVKQISDGTIKRYMSICKKIMEGSTDRSLMIDLKPTQAYKMLGIIKDNNNVHFSSETNEWFTPDRIIQNVIELFGEIDLDPCADKESKSNVPAKIKYTQNDDGLTKEWHGKVYMNPPYGREIPYWISKIKKEYESKNISEAIILAPSRTDTEWFIELKYYLHCFIFGRLQFCGQENSAPFPSMIIYIGKNEKRFYDVFSPIGDIYKLMGVNE